MRLKSLLEAGLCLVAAAFLGGCGFIPMAGPSSLQIRSEQSPTLPYAMVKLNPKVVHTLENYEPNVLGGVFTDRREPANILFGIGDVVSITIFEATAGGLFIPIEAGVRPGNFVNLPDQIVDNDGNISVPYAGIIRAAGRTNVQIQDAIVQRIKKRAIEPQVVVTAS